MKQLQEAVREQEEDRERKKEEEGSVEDKSGGT